MMAFLGVNGWAPNGAAEVLQYTAPDGSVLAGGTVFVGLSAHGFGDRAAAIAVIYTPAYAHDASNIVIQCIARVPCQNGVSEFYGPAALPRDRSGSLYLAAACGGEAPGTFCSEGASRGVRAGVAVAWANLRLATLSLPTGSDFRGSVLEAGAHGTANLAFAAGDSDRASTE